MTCFASPLRRSRLCWPEAAGPVFALCLAFTSTGCTDRLAPSDDRWGRDGALIAVSGGEGGARYACIGCHGVRGEGNGFDAPRLAGLPAGYLQKQMEDYAAGLRPHAVMREVARFLDSHERVRVANHYAALPPAALPTSRITPTDDAPIRALYARACQDCHGERGQGGPLGPPLSGQPAPYLVQQLQDWQESKRRNDGEHAMLQVARRLKDEEIVRLAHHLAAIPPRPAAADR